MTLKIVAFALFGTALTGGILNTTTSTTCAWDSTSITDPSACSFSGGSFAVSASAAADLFLVAGGMPNDAVVDLSLDAFAVPNPQNSAEASGTVKLTLLTAGTGQPGLMLIGLAAISDVFDVGKCSITVEAGGLSFASLCDPSGNPVNVGGIPIKLGHALTPIVVTLTGDVSSISGGSRSAAMSANISVFNPDGSPAMFAPEPATWLLCLAGLALVFRRQKAGDRRRNPRNPG